MRVKHVTYPDKLNNPLRRMHGNLKMTEKKRGRPFNENKPIVIKGFAMPLFKNDIKYLNKIKKVTGFNERQCVREAVKFFSEYLNKPDKFIIN